MDFLEENKLLREKIRNITQRVYAAGGSDSTHDYDKGWDDAIAEVLSIIEEEAGLTAEEIMNPKCG